MPHQRREAPPLHAAPKKRSPPQAAPKRQYKEAAGGDACVPGHASETPAYPDIPLQELTNNYTAITC